MTSLTRPLCDTRPRHCLPLSRSQGTSHHPYSEASSWRRAEAPDHGGVARPSMDGSISTFCGALSAFLSHLHSTSAALSDSLRRRPIPLDSAAAAFVERLGQRAATAAADVELLDDMAMGTVSVAELLGHCGEVYRRNQSYVDLLQDRLSAFGYVPEIDSDDGESEDFDADSKPLGPENGLEKPMLGCGSALGAGSVRRRLDGDPLYPFLHLSEPTRLLLILTDRSFDGSLTLQNMGLSDASLATLASEANDFPPSPIMQAEDLVGSNKGEACEDRTAYHSSSQVVYSKGMLQEYPIPDKCASGASIKFSKEDYDKLPAYVKSLAPWEDLEEAVIKMNAVLCSRDTSNKSSSLCQDDLEALGLGRKGKSYVLALIRMNRLAVETVSGSVAYRVDIK
ncbi:hypothetical protein Taro_006965 [Colocasia esculenta]|uniref:Spindle and kinetochore-associated protein 3 n=1 Tax=Colocasia esculenta TaxID=4460 RepID=A0A843TXN1_COLES|nr:hypothetical protein [Colocasia esculenta]